MFRQLSGVVRAKNRAGVPIKILKGDQYHYEVELFFDLRLPITNLFDLLIKVRMKVFDEIYTDNLDTGSVIEVKLETGEVVEIKDMTYRGIVRDIPVRRQHMN